MLRGISPEWGIKVLILSPDWVMCSPSQFKNDKFDLFITPMGHLPKGHISIHPHELNGREHLPVIRRSSDGDELVAEFDAKIIMEWTAYEDLSKDAFKVR